jgi:hypothetical protein
MNFLGLMIGFPFLALLPATLFAFFYIRSRCGVTLVAALAWLAYFPYEQAMKLRILCTGECNIRVDLLLFYPVLAIVSVMAVAAYLQASRRSK